MRFRALPLAVLAVLLASPALGALPVPGPGAAAVPTFRAPVTLPGSTNFGEPSIAADAAYLFVAAPGSATSVWRSSDGGASFDSLPDSLGSSGDSDVALGGDGTLYVSDLFDNVPVSVSTDGGLSYAYKTATSGTNNVDRQWVAAHGAGNVFSSLRDDSGSSSALRVATSRDHGRTYVSHLAASDVSLEGGIVAAGDDDLWVPFVDGSSALRVARSVDGGVTWASSAVAGNVNANLFPALAVDAAGNAYVAWPDAGSSLFSNDRILVASSTDGGAHWSTPTVVSAPNTYAIFPWIAAGAAGKVAVAWYEGKPVAGVEVDPNLAALTPWTVQVAYSSDAASATPHYAATAATPVMHQGSICTFGTLCAPLRASPVLSRSLLDFFEITALPNGNLALAYAADASSLHVGGATVLQVVVQNGGPNLG